MAEQNRMPRGTSGQQRTVGQIIIGVGVLLFLVMGLLTMMRVGIIPIPESYEKYREQMPNVEMALSVAGAVFMIIGGSIVYYKSRHPGHRRPLRQATPAGGDTHPGEPTITMAPLLHPVSAEYVALAPQPPPRPEPGPSTYSTQRPTPLEPPPGYSSMYTAYPQADTAYPSSQSSYPTGGYAAYPATQQSYPQQTSPRNAGRIGESPTRNLYNFQK